MTIHHAAADESTYTVTTAKSEVGHEVSIEGHHVGRVTRKGSGWVGRVLTGDRSGATFTHDGFGQVRTVKQATAHILLVCTGRQYVIANPAKAEAYEAYEVAEAKVDALDAAGACQIDPDRRAAREEALRLFDVWMGTADYIDTRDVLDYGRCEATYSAL